MTWLPVGIMHYLILSATLFSVGLFGVLISRKSIITLLMSIELMLLAVNINMVAFSSYTHNLSGQIFTLFILTIAAAEAAIGLAIVVIYYRNRGAINIDDVNLLKG